MIFIFRYLARNPEIKVLGYLNLPLYSASPETPFSLNIRVIFSAFKKEIAGQGDYFAEILFSIILTVPGEVKTPSH